MEKKVQQAGYILFRFSRELRCPCKTVCPTLDEKSYTRFATFCPKHPRGKTMLKKSRMGTHPSKVQGK